jgi:hypothetical protein
VSGTASVFSVKFHYRFNWNVLYFYVDFSGEPF